MYTLNHILAMHMLVIFVLEDNKNVKGEITWRKIIITQKEMPFYYFWAMISLLGQYAYK